MTDPTFKNTSFIAEGTSVDADINSEGNIHISGVVDGNIITKEHLILNDIGKINGNVNAKTAIISGTIKGDLRIAENLKLLAKAKIIGNIFAKEFSTEEGAEINGMLKIGKDIHVAPEQVVKEVSLQKKAG